MSGKISQDERDVRDLLLDPKRRYEFEKYGGLPGGPTEDEDPARYRRLKKLLEEREREFKRGAYTWLANTNGVKAEPSGRRVKLTSAGEIRSERVRWLWKGRIPLRGQTIIPGGKGLGKSILSNAWLVAKLTRGELEGELEGQPVDVLIVSAEDDWASVVKPRLMAHGADLDRVHRVVVQDEVGESLLTLPDDVQLLEGEIDRLEETGCKVGMVVIDPIGAFIAEKTDSHKDAPVRRALAPLASMAERRDLAVVVVAHLTKDETKKLISRVSGAGAFVNAARSVLAFARDPSDPEGEQGRERVLVHVGTNWGSYAPSLAARIESREVDVDDGSKADVGSLVVTGETDVQVDDLQRGADEDGSDCEALIGAALTGGSRPSHEVKEEVAKRLGCARKTVERHAVRMSERGELDIASGGFPRTTTWTLANEDVSAGTSLDARIVPTRENRIPERLQVPNGDSGDSAASPKRNVATEPRCKCPEPLLDDPGDPRCTRCYGWPA
jgi:AAA domain-containing protein